VIGLCQCLFGEAASAKALLELIDTTARVDDLLRAGVERVASGASINQEVLAQGGASFEGVAAGASGSHFFVTRMNIGAHSKFL